MRAADESRHPRRRVRLALVVEIRQPRLPAIASRQPAEEVVKAAILHHHHDDLVDLRSGRRGQRLRRGGGLYRSCECRRGRRTGGIAKKISAIDRHVRLPRFCAEATKNVDARRGEFPVNDR
jgi:hypothetical protein